MPKTTPLSDTLDCKKLQQRDLIEKLEAIGHKVSQQSVSAWVQGKYLPRPILQAAVAHVLDVPTYLLFPPPPLVIRERPREDVAA